MIKLHQLKIYRGSRKRRKVVGRGLGSGHGTFSGRGIKGQRARKSGNSRPGFEGGRQPLIRQAPKLRGFKSHRQQAMAVRLAALNKFEDGATVDLQSLVKRKIVSKGLLAKIVLGGELKKKLTVAVPVSETAKAAIVKAGGTVK